MVKELTGQADEFGATTTLVSIPGLKPWPTSAETNECVPCSTPGLPPRMSSVLPLNGYQLMGAPGVGAHACAVEVTLNGLDVALTLPAAAFRVSPIPAALMERSGNVAMPTAFVICVSVPLKVPGPELRLSVIKRPGMTALLLS